MNNITEVDQVSIDDIKSFLSINGLKINDDKQARKKAFDLMKKQNTIYDDVPISIIEWMMAYNLTISKKEITIYTENEIKNLSDNDRRKLADLLDMKNSNVNNIINILKYYYKLRKTLFTDLPNDMILNIFDNMKINDIMTFCVTNKNINNICQTQDLKNIIISKMSKDRLDVSDFTLKELFLYSKVLNLKRKISFFNNRINVYLDNFLYTPYQNDIDFSKNAIPKNLNVDQIAPYGYHGNDLALLSKNGKISSINIYDYISHLPLPKEGEKIDDFFDKEIDVSKIIKIEPRESGSKALKILTVDGKYYEWDGYNGFKNVSSPDGLIQKAGNYFLTYTGEVYHGKYPYLDFTKIKYLKNIKQITDAGYFLSEEGNVYIYFDYGDNIISQPGIKNITQLSTEYGEMRSDNKYEKHIYMLDNKGNVYFKAIIRDDMDKIDLSVPKLQNELKDIVEIGSNSGVGFVALDKYNRLSIKFRDYKMQLYQWEFK